jgi:hypothetical protein
MQLEDLAVFHWKVWLYFIGKFGRISFCLLAVFSTFFGLPNVVIPCYFSNEYEANSGVFL